MSAGLYAIVIEQEATFYRKLQWLDPSSVPIDLTGYTAKMQVRATAADSSIIVELSTTNSYITITPSTGTIELTIPASVTATVPVANAVYSLNMTSPDGFVTRLLQGQVQVKASITR